MTPLGRPRGGVVTRRTANPFTPVRFRAWPPSFPKIGTFVVSALLVSRLMQQCQCDHRDYIQANGIDRQHGKGWTHTLVNSEPQQKK